MGRKSGSKSVFAVLGASLLAACGAEDVQRIELAAISPAAAAVPLASPDTSTGAWQIAANGRALSFAGEGQPPLLTLACDLADLNAPQIDVIRHATAQPGAKALFAVIGNGMIARLYVEAELAEGTWRWQGHFPASDPRMQVFTGPRDLEATLPGAGMLEIAGSELPRDFVTWCQEQGLPPPVVEPSETGTGGVPAPSIDLTQGEEI
jgi:hypothetical protein